MMQTTQITTWCCHEDGDNLFNLEDEDSDSVPIPVMQESTEKRLKVYKGFHKPNAVKTRDDLNDLDSSRVTNLTIKDSVAYHEDEDEGDDEESDEEKESEIAQDCHPVHSVRVYSCHSVRQSVILSRVLIYIR